MIGNLKQAEFNDLLFAVAKDEAFSDTVLHWLSKDNLIAVFRSLKLIELSMAAATGGISTRGIDSIILVKSKFKGNPFISRRSSRMIQDFVVKNPDLCRSVPSDDVDENVRRVTAFYKALSASQEKPDLLKLKRAKNALKERTASSDN